MYTRRAFIVASRQSAKRRESRRVQSGSDARGGDERVARGVAAERAGKAEAKAAVGVVEGNRVREVVIEGG